jgi:hypothetical protein
MSAGTLRVVSGASAGTSVDVDGEVVVGREGADLPLIDQQISRRHAALRPVDGGIEVEDLGSLNGTYVDGERVGGPVTVQASAALRVGTTEMALEIVAPEPLAAPEATVIRDVLPAAEHTRARDVPAPDVTRMRDIPAPDVTRVRDVPDADVTRMRDAPAPAAPQEQAAPAQARSPLPLMAVGLAVAAIVAVLVILLL